MYREKKIEGVDYCNLPRSRGEGYIHSNGYVLISVGKDHALADSRGRAYEHRLVASRILGRWITGDEQVHHKNGITSDNHPSNLEIYSSRFEHMVQHRNPSSRRRMPGEDNPIIECSCGCGLTLTKYDDCNRPRNHIHSHAIPMGTNTLALLNLYRKFGAISNADIRSRLLISNDTCQDCVRRLKKNGFITKVSHGVWKLKENNE